MSFVCSHDFGHKDILDIKTAQNPPSSGSCCKLSVVCLCVAACKVSNQNFIIFSCFLKLGSTVDDTCNKTNLVYFLLVLHR